MMWRRLPTWTHAWLAITRAHKNVNEQTPDELRADIDHIDARCRAYGITHPTTFAIRAIVTVQPQWRSCAIAASRCPSRNRSGVLQWGGGGPAYDPTCHDRRSPTTCAAGPAYSLDDFKWSVNQATEGQVCCLSRCPISIAWVHVDPDVFTTHMRYYRTMPVKSSPCATSSATCLWSERIVHLRCLQKDHRRGLPIDSP